MSTVLEKRKGWGIFPALVVAVSLDSRGEGICGSGLWLCLWAEIFTGPWMVHSSVIEKIKLFAVKMVLEKKKGWNILTCACGCCFSWLLTVEGNFGGGGCDCVCGLRYPPACGWFIAVKLKKILAVKMVLEKRKGRGVLTYACGQCFSWQQRRGCWWRRLLIVSVGWDIHGPVDGA